MGKGKNAKRRKKKRLQALQRAREEAATAASAATAATAAAGSTAGAARVPVPDEAAMVEAMMNITGQSREYVLKMRDTALNFVQSQPKDVVMAKAHQVLTKTTSELHTSVEDVHGFAGRDMHVWHEVDGAIYGLPGGINGDIQEYNKDNPNSRYTLRRAYPAELQNECFNEFVLPKIGRACRIPSHAVEKLLRDDPGLNSEKWKGSCVERAALLMAHCPHTFDQDTLRIGGVGWRTQEGEVHWEFG